MPRARFTEILRRLAAEGARPKDLAAVPVLRATLEERDRAR